ncbi:MAG: DUF488 family protein [Kiloniellales bacterium]|nr:DUF488 family protein [Kiloniellales bacterium]
MAIKVKRVYDEAARDDGARVLVDRVWPRGLAKGSLRIDLWAKDLAPSTALRKWFDHDRTKWEAFKDRYFRELDEAGGAGEPLAALLSQARDGDVTLVFGAKDTQCNNAVALKQYLEQRLEA